MNLLRINDQILNADLIESVSIRGNELTLFVTGRPISFSGAEARVLTQWFLSNARDLTSLLPSAAVAPARIEAGDGANSGVQLFKMPLP
jgi:hypothetical protein